MTQLGEDRTTSTTAYIVNQSTAFPVFIAYLLCQVLKNTDGDVGTVDGSTNQKAFAQMALMSGTNRRTQSPALGLLASPSAGEGQPPLHVNMDEVQF